MLTRVAHRPVRAACQILYVQRWSLQKRWKATATGTTPAAPTHKSTTILIRSPGRHRSPMSAIREIIESFPREKHTPDPATPFDAAVVVASRSLASWLEDRTFMQDLLRLTAWPSVVLGPPAKMTVLAAAVDDIPHPDKTASMAGISVIQGYRDQLLPDLWDNAERTLQNDIDARAAITFNIPPLKPAEDDPEPPGPEVEVTVPTASTVFYNGRGATMFATEWATEPGYRRWKDFKIARQLHVTKQMVCVPMEPDEKTALAVPLLPITEPRRVESGLGNIVNKIEIDDEVHPASAELESVLPMMLQQRAQMRLREIRGAVNVWAVVVPGAVVETRITDVEFLFDYSPWDDEGPGFEPTSLRRLLRKGCRIHKILSGGGGWGAKRGLLSLDSERRPAITEQEEIDAFEQAFLGKYKTRKTVEQRKKRLEETYARLGMEHIVEPHNVKERDMDNQTDMENKAETEPSREDATEETKPEESTQSEHQPIVQPGDWVMFFVEPTTYPAPVQNNPRASDAGLEQDELGQRLLQDRFLVRVDRPAESNDLEPPGPGIVVVPDFFGLVSHKCAFLGPSTAEGHGDTAMASVKIDVPGTELRVSAV